MTIPKACPKLSWHYNGDLFRVVESAIYLGLNLHPKHGLISNYIQRVENVECMGHAESAVRWAEVHCLRELAAQGL